MTNTETITWHDYKPGDVQSKLHRLFSNKKEVDNMSVRIGEVATFPDAKADKAQVLKIAEEYSEVFSAWEDYDRNDYLYSEERAHLVDECADCITAICNLLAALGVDDMRGAMAECEQRNRKRGRL